MADDPKEGRKRTDILSYPEEESEAQVATEEKTQVKEPSMYRVILLNDDYTPMEFVVWLLQSVFQKSAEESTRIMMQVHTQGRGICGIFPHDVARSKMYQVQGLAEKHGHPLQCTMEADGV